MLRPDLLEAGEGNALVGAILWLAKTILETLLPTGELDAWLQRVGLAGDIGELKSGVERMETVVNGVGGRAVGNKPLARSLARVKELMYDADDVVDELDYCRLQHQVERAMIAPAIDLDGMVGDGAEQVDASANTFGMLAPTEPKGVVGDGDRDREEQADASANNTGTLNNSGRKNRAEVRDYFQIIPSVNGEPAKAKCNCCGRELTWGHGTSALHKHLKSCNKKRSVIEETPNRPSVGDSVQNGATISTYDSEGRKRMRIEYNVAATTHFLKRIQEIVLELRSIRHDVIEYLKDSIARPDQYQINNSDTRVRTSSSLPGKVYGRGEEKDKIIRAIEAAKSDNITVLPIVGILGVGKTVLAKLVYKDPRVERKFERIWVWVSNIFDEVRVTREILDVVTMASHEGSRNRESYEGVSNCSKLLEVLKKHIACLSKKFLLVLDDVYDCMDNSQWKDLIDALGSSCRKGNVIIVTVRNLAVAKRLGTIEPVKLRALENYDFWLLFKACAFGDNQCKEHLDIGRQIATKLNGNPLAAENAADMLREQPGLHHWKTIMKNGIWESLQLRGGIVTALKNIYYQLPYNLQQCFLACSIFPSDHQFHIDGLVSMWISSGFVKSIETGWDYLNALVNSCFFEQVGTKDDSILQQCYVMCGMMHEFARLVSRTEFATIDGLECKEVLPTVRHLSIQTDLVYHIDECENIVGNVKFEEKLQSIASSLKRLRTVILVGRYDSLFVQFKSFHTFISNLVDCTHLRYLKLDNKGKSESLPISLSKFYHLEILDAGCQAIVHDMSDLISMRHLVLTKGACGSFSPARSASLQMIHLEDCKGWQIIPSLESLSSLTKLKLRNMTEVTELLIPSLEELVLIDMPKLETCFSNSVRDLNSSLRVLEIRRCWVLKAFILFESCENFEIEHMSWLPSVSELTIHECPHLMVSNPLPPSRSVFKLSITKVSALPKMEGSSNGEYIIGSYVDRSTNDFFDDKILSFHNLRTITRLEIVGFNNLLSILLEGLKQLVCLKRLEIRSCQTNFSSDVSSTHTHEYMTSTNFDAGPSLECLSIIDCGIIGQWLSMILQHVQALETLDLGWCGQITGLLIQGKENTLSNPTSAPCVSSQGNPDGASTRPCPNKLLRIPSNLIPSLKKMSIECCELKFLGNKECFSGFTSLEELRIVECPELISSLVREDEIDDQANGRWLLPCSLGILDIDDASLETLQPCFPGDLTCLKVLEVWKNDTLKYLQLHSCTALEELAIRYCKSLDALEGVRSLRGLRYLHLYRCPGLPQCLKSLSTQGYELFPRLERLRIDDPSFLTTPFCKHLTSLQCLQLVNEFEDTDVAGLTCEQEAALQLLTSLQELGFHYCSKLSDLPVGLHSHPSLKWLEIIYCPSISRLPERGLPPSLEELEVRRCSMYLTEQCRMLATSKLNVKIDGNYVN
ncbi:putative disease resistance protein RGA3 [Miscanthus floridulus]|uniref:putative disease resistance protein RGA3 n=1 Tax=Miscanthus floridulus TaxID=154761 RepID=UPI00345872DB